MVDELVVWKLISPFTIPINHSCRYIWVFSLNGGIPNLHPKMISFSNGKPHGFVGETHPTIFRKKPPYTNRSSHGIQSWDCHQPSGQNLSEKMLIPKGLAMKVARRPCCCASSSMAFRRRNSSRVSQGCCSDQTIGKYKESYWLATPLKFGKIRKDIYTYIYIL